MTSSSTRLGLGILRMLLRREDLREGEGISALRLDDRRRRNTERVDRRRDIGLTDVEDGGVIVGTERGRNVGIVEGSKGRQGLIQVRRHLLRVLRVLGHHALTGEVHQGRVHHVTGSKVQGWPAVDPGHHHGLVPDEHLDLHVSLSGGE